MLNKNNKNQQLKNNQNYKLNKSIIKLFKKNKNQLIQVLHHLSQLPKKVLFLKLRKIRNKNGTILDCQRY